MLKILIMIACGWFGVDAKPKIMTAKKQKISYEYNNPLSIHLGALKANNTLVAILAPSCGHCYHFVNRTLPGILEKYPDLGITIILNPLNFIDMEIAKIIFSHKNPFTTLKFFLEYQYTWIRPYQDQYSIEEKKNILEKYDDAHNLTDENDEYMFLKLFLMEENPPFLNPDLAYHQKQSLIKNVFKISKYIKDYDITGKMSGYKKNVPGSFNFTPIFFLDDAFLGKGANVEDKLEELLGNE